MSNGTKRIRAPLFTYLRSKGELSSNIKEGRRGSRRDTPETEVGGLHLEIRD